MNRAQQALSKFKNINEGYGITQKVPGETAKALIQLNLDRVGQNVMSVRNAPVPGSLVVSAGDVSLVTVRKEDGKIILSCYNSFDNNVTNVTLTPEEFTNMKKFS